MTELNYKKIAAAQREDAKSVNKQLKEVTQKQEALKRALR
jgi:hypothetical protein